MRVMVQSRLQSFAQSLAAETPEPARAEATVPLAALRALPRIGDRIAALPVLAAPGVWVISARP